MSSIQIIVFTIAVFVVAFEPVQATTGHRFTVEQYFGTWYDIGSISPPYATPQTVTCAKYEVSRIFGSDIGFREHYKFFLNDYRREYKGHGEIIDSEMFVTIPLLKQVNIPYTLLTYNNNTEVILEKSDDKRYYGLLSRKPTISATTRAEFEKLAKRIGVRPKYIDHDFCFYY